MDGLGNGVGYFLVLMFVATIREIFGNGTWFGIELFSIATEEGGFRGNKLMAFPVSAFFILGITLYLVTAISERRGTDNTDQGGGR